jgi:methionine-rich copper-binding protein CopC
MKLRHTIAISFLLLLAPSLAQAHAFLDHAEPKVGSTLTASPTQVKIWFTEELEGAFSKIRVFDAADGEVDNKDVKIDRTNAAIMTVSLPKLPPGIYTVKWNAVAVDTHHTSGKFNFTIVTP